MILNKSLKKIFCTAMGLLVGLCAVPTVSANTVNTEVGSLTIHKYEQNDVFEGILSSGLQLTADEIKQMLSDKGAKPLAGVTFEINQIGDEDTLESYTVVADTMKSAVTDENGFVSFAELPLGRYIIKETAAPINVSEKTPDFIIDIPTTNISGDGLIYDVHIYPKNVTVYGSIIFTKLNGDSETEEGLAGAQFKLERKTDNVFSAFPSESSCIFTTGSDGKFIINNLPKGEYRLTETESPDNFLIDKTPILFTISKSGLTTIKGGEYSESGTVQKLSLKNYNNPVIHKSVTESGNQSYSASIGNDVKWIIEPSIPNGIADFTLFEISDTINNALTYNEGSAVVKIDDVAVEKGVDYLITEPTATDKTLKITFIKDTFKNESLSDAKSLSVEFTTAINQNASLGTAIENQASLEYKNEFMTQSKTAYSEKPEVHLGGISFFKFAKIDGIDIALSGAEFKIASSKANAKAEDYLRIDANGKIIDIGETGYDNATDIVAVSGKNGIVSFAGLKYGSIGDKALTAKSDYYIVETVAPIITNSDNTITKYNLLREPLKVEINATSHKIPETISSETMLGVRNKTGFELPLTGGVGSFMYLICGGSLMGLCIALYMRNKKRKAQ